MPQTRRQFLAAGAATLGAVLLGGCGHADGVAADLGGWDAVLEAARGQTVRWATPRGAADPVVAGRVTDALRTLGVTLERVAVTDAPTAVAQVLAESNAGSSDDGGSLDAITLAGAAFATGQQDGLWYTGWARALPNSRYLDFSDESVTADFGIVNDGAEAAWSRTETALVVDSAVLGEADAASVTTLFAWARAHPGRFTYPAPTDPTGALAVRRFLYDTIDGPDSLRGPFNQAAYTASAKKLWPRLQEVAPSLWRGGASYPQSQDEVEALFAAGTISAYLTGDPGGVGAQVRAGRFPSSTREVVLQGGGITHCGFVAIPANASHKPAALVLANVLQDPQTQLALFSTAGILPAVDLALLPADVQQAFAVVPRSLSVLPVAALTANSKPELAVGYASALAQGWEQHVLRP